MLVYGIPNLKLDFFGVRNSDEFGAELDAYSHVVLVGEFVVEELIENARFSDGWISDDDVFEYVLEVGTIHAIYRAAMYVTRLAN